MELFLVILSNAAVSLCIHILVYMRAFHFSGAYIPRRVYISLPVMWRCSPSEELPDCAPMRLHDDAFPQGLLFSSHIFITLVIVPLVGSSHPSMCEVVAFWLPQTEVYDTVSHVSK